MSVINQLDEFIEDSSRMKYGRNLWLEDSIMKVYVRKSTRFIDDEKLIALDIATVEVDQKYQGKGIFSKFLDYVQNSNPWDVVYVESVLNPIVLKMLEKRGYTQMKHIPGSYYLRTKHK